MKLYIIVCLCLIGSLLGISKYQLNKDFKSYGVVTQINTNDIVIDTVSTNPLRKSTRPCLVINLKEESLQCHEQYEELTYTHSINLKDISPSTSQQLSLGVSTLLNLPTLVTKQVNVHKQYVYLNSYELNIGSSVFVDGITDSNKQVTVKGVFKTDISPLFNSSNSSNSFSSSTSLNSSNSFTNNRTASSIVLVYVPSKPSIEIPYKFYMYRKEGERVGIYELMTPNVKVDKGDSSSVLENESWIGIDKVITMSSDLSIVYGISESKGLSSYLNESNIQVPTYKHYSSSTYNISNESFIPTKHKQRKNFISQLQLKDILFWVLITPICLFIGIRGDSIISFLVYGRF